MLFVTFHRGELTSIGMRKVMSFLFYFSEGDCSFHSYMFFPVTVKTQMSFGRTFFIDISTQIVESILLCKKFGVSGNASSNAHFLHIFEHKLLSHPYIAKKLVYPKMHL